jgi:hypothetical protein
MRMMQDERIDDHEGSAAAWAACTKTPPSGSPAGSQLAQALLHAASLGLCRTARDPLDEADPQVVLAARVFCLLQIALRSGSCDPEAPGERRVWTALQRMLPGGWTEALARAAAAGQRASNARGKGTAVRPGRGAGPRVDCRPTTGRSGRPTDPAGKV